MFVLATVFLVWSFAIVLLPRQIVAFVGRVSVAVDRSRTLDSHAALSTWHAQLVTVDLASRDVLNAIKYPFGWP